LPNEVNFSDSAVLKQKGVLGLVQDELLWGAIWLHEATMEESYLEYVANNAEQMGGTGWTMNQFSWENKYVGVQIKATKLLLDGKTGQYAPIFEKYRAKAEYFLCAALQKNKGPQIQLTPGRLGLTEICSPVWSLLFRTLCTKIDIQIICCS
jgi:hypothetical protein